MTLKPDVIIHINYQPLNGRFDLVDRIKAGWQKAKEAGVLLAFVIENDDWYPFDYFERFESTRKHDFFGDESSLYYNLKNKSYKRYDHLGRASLYTTGFRVSSLDSFIWPGNNTPFLDIELWKFAKRWRKKFVHTHAIGIKTGLGLCGGKGHKLNGQPDNGTNWLKHNVDSESFEFYSKLKLHHEYV